MELRQLRYFDVLCEELHFARAAARLRLSQPALSIQLKSLEQELGTTLLVRSNRKVELTQSGHLFLAEARKTLNQARKAIDTAKQAERGDLGRIAIDFTSHSAHVGVLSAWLGIFAKRHSQVELTLREVPTVAQFEGLKNGTADIAFVTTFDDGKASGLKLVRLAKMPMIIAMPSSHHLCRHKQIDIEALRHEHFVTLAVDDTVTFEDLLGFTPRVVQTVTSETALQSLIAAGLGLAIVPQGVAALNHSKEVAFRRLKRANLTISVGLAFRETAYEPVVKAFLSSAPPAFHPIKTN